MDLYSRRIVGWSMDRWINRHLVIDALNMAIGQRCPEGELLHHSDRGSQYTSDDFRDELEKHNIQCSMSARGNCYDNAVVESFFGLMKRERVNRTRYLTRDEAKADVFDYIERFYNRKRRHGYLGNISPAVFEERYQNQFQTVHQTGAKPKHPKADSRVIRFRRLLLTQNGHSGKNVYSSISPTRNIVDNDDGASKNYIGNGSVSDHHWLYNKFILQPS